MVSEPKGVGSPDQQELVRCSSCRAAVSSALTRCSYCGQIMTGSEQSITQKEAESQRREGRPRHRCKLCGKTVAGSDTLCSKCEAADQSKRRLLTLIFVFAVVAIIWLFS